MLYIVVNRSGNLSESKWSVWHIGKFNPVPSQDCWNVVEVRADGDELEYLKGRFPFVLNNIPQHLEGTRWVQDDFVYWYGDQAKFIVGNLT